jgi:nucleotide-binding universal stress UspA family protein
MLASQLARRTGARLTLVRVLAESLGRAAGSDIGGGKDSIRDLLLDVETRSVEALAERARADGVDVSIEVCWGVPWEVVLDRIEREAFDLVVKPASGLNRDGPVFFGSTALHLFRRCPCPVWVVGDDGRLPGAILAAVDPSGALPRRAAAERILDWAERVRDWADASLHVVSAWSAPAAALLRDSLDAGELEEYVRSAHDLAQTDLEALLAARSPAPPPSNVHLAEGDTPEALTRFAREHAVDLIVMGTRGREDRVGDLLGETAETIIRHVRSSVLTIPPAAR